MMNFSALCSALEAGADGEDGPEVRVARIAACLAAQAPADAAYTVHFLSGGRVPRCVDAVGLRAWVAAHTGLDAAVMAEAEAHVGDVAECAALLVDTARPPPESGVEPGLAEVVRALATLRGGGRGRTQAALGSTFKTEDHEAGVPAVVASLWRSLPTDILFHFNKLLVQGRISGAGWARPGLALAEALALRLNRSAAVIAARLAADFVPDAEGWATLSAPETSLEAQLAEAEAAAPEPSPLTLRAVLLYVDGQGGRRGTFGVWREGELVPVAKAEMNLPVADQARLSAWVKAHTGERFGPVRQVEASQVFELRAAGIEAASRRKAGLVLVGVEVLSWHPEVEASTAHGLEHLRSQLVAAGG